jgi:hypothetical protein
VSTAKTLHSIRRLVAFVAVVLSLLLLGVGELALEVDYSPIALGLVVAGLAATVLSSIWFLVTVFSLAPTDDGSGRGASEDEGAATAGNDD